MLILHQAYLKVSETYRSAPSHCCQNRDSLCSPHLYVPTIYNSPRRPDLSSLAGSLHFTNCNSAFWRFGHQEIRFFVLIGSIVSWGCLPRAGAGLPVTAAAGCRTLANKTGHVPLTTVHTACASWLSSLGECIHWRHEAWRARAAVNPHRHRVPNAAGVQGTELLCGSRCGCSVVAITAAASSNARPVAKLRGG